MNSARRLLAISATVVLLSGLLPEHGQCQDYPVRPIRILVGYAAGGVVDVVGRQFATELSARLGQPVIIDNLPGAFMQRPSEIVRHAPADGYTLMIGTSEMTLWPSLKRSYRFQLATDFTPIAMLANNWTVFATHPGVPARSLPEFVAYARNNPGKLRYGSSGVGGVLHIVAELLKLSAGLDMIHVPYRGGSQSVTDLMAGQIEMASIGLSSARAAEGGRLNILAQAGLRRHPMFPDVPTTAEYGYPDVRVEPWFSLIGPPNLPPEIIARLNNEIQGIVTAVDFKDKLERIGLAPFYMPHAEFVGFIPGDMQRWKELIPAMRIEQLD
jgi:tripartite-type tricarboxylate transporter receptor subunit TctC